MKKRKKLKLNSKSGYKKHVTPDLSQANEKLLKANLKLSIEIDSLKKKLKELKAS